MPSNIFIDGLRLNVRSLRGRYSAVGNTHGIGEDSLFKHETTLVGYTREYEFDLFENDVTFQCSTLKYLRDKCFTGDDVILMILAGLESTGTATVVTAGFDSCFNDFFQKTTTSGSTSITAVTHCEAPITCKILGVDFSYKDIAGNNHREFTVSLKENQPSN